MNSQKKKLSYIIFFCLIILTLFFVFNRFTKNDSEQTNIGPEFLKDLIALESKEGVPALAKKYGFIKETDPERSAFYTNKTIDGTIEVLSVDGLYLSLNYDSYENACAASTEMVEANLEEPLSFKYQAIWPKQISVTSRWTGQGEQSHVSLTCEQYSEKGLSSVDININFTLLNTAK